MRVEHWRADVKLCVTAGSVDLGLHLEEPS